MLSALMTAAYYNLHGIPLDNARTPSEQQHAVVAARNRSCLLPLQMEAAGGATPVDADAQI